MSGDSTTESISAVQIRRPRVEDGPAVYDLIAASPPLETNSRYVNLLQCTHFSDTCALAELDATLVGWVGAYLVPADPTVLFVWQVTVAEAVRGGGLAVGLVRDILRRPECRGVRHVHATVTDENASSWRMFRSLAAALDAPCDRAPLFDRDRHLGGVQSTEFLLRIGPFEPAGAHNSEVQ